MDHTHKLPPHLGAWPCRILAAPPHDRTVVEYQTSDSIWHTIAVAHDELTRIMPAEPTAPYVIGADGGMYKLMPGCEPGTTERLWREVGEIHAVTWGALTIAWDEENQTQPIVPLVPADAWLDNAPELPYVIPVSAGGHTGDYRVSRVDDGSPFPIHAGISGNIARLHADAAEQFGLALLRAAHEVRAANAVQRPITANPGWVPASLIQVVGSAYTTAEGTAVYPPGTFVKAGPAPVLCDDCPNQALCLLDGCQKGGKQ